MNRREDQPDILERLPLSLSHNRLTSVTELIENILTLSGRRGLPDISTYDIDNNVELSLEPGGNWYLLLSRDGEDREFLLDIDIDGVYTWQEIIDIDTGPQDEKVCGYAFNVMIGYRNEDYFNLKTVTVVTEDPSITVHNYDEMLEKVRENIGVEENLVILNWKELGWYSE